MYFTYILFSEGFNRFYIGSTQDISIRLMQHNGGSVKSTKPYKPWTLFWIQTYSTRSESMVRERKLKNLKSKKRLIGYAEKHGQFKYNDSSEFLQKIRESSKN